MTGVFYLITCRVYYHAKVLTHIHVPFQASNAYESQQLVMMLRSLVDVDLPS